MENNVENTSYEIDRCTSTPLYDVRLASYACPVRVSTLTSANQPECCIGGVRRGSATYHSTIRQGATGASSRFTQKPGDVSVEPFAQLYTSQPRKRIAHPSHKQPKHDGIPQTRHISDSNKESPISDRTREPGAECEKLPDRKELSLVKRERK